MAPRFAFMALLVFALTFAATQCVAACAVDECNSAAPPCHQHHGPSKACHQEVQLAVAHAGSAMPAVAIAMAWPVVMDAPLLAHPESRAATALSPPGRSPNDLRILRI